MNKALLMHDYCLFPGSEEQDLRRLDEFIAFNKKEFEKEWEEPDQLSDSDLFASSPTMNSLWEDNNNYYIHDNFTSPLSQASTMAMDEDQCNLELDEPSSVPLTEKSESYNENEGIEAWNEIEEMVKSKTSGKTPVSSSNPNPFHGLNEGNVDLLFELRCIDPSLISPVPVYTPTVAVASELHTPTHPAAPFKFPAETQSQIMPVQNVSAGGGGRRKTELVKREVVDTPEPEFLDIKPRTNLVPTPAATVPSTRASRKRPLPAPVASPAPASASAASSSVVMNDFAEPSTPSNRKLKKYELNDPDNHSVKNAKAAKANRERKKQEEAALKQTNEQQKQLLEEFKASLAEKDRQIMELTQQLIESRARDRSAEGLRAIEGRFQEYLATVVASLSANPNYGPISIQMSPDLANGNGYGNVLLSNPNQNQHSRIITTHFNPDNGQLTWDYNPNRNLN